MMDWKQDAVSKARKKLELFLIEDCKIVVLVKMTAIAINTEESRYEKY